MKRHRFLIRSGFDIPRSKLALAALCGLAAHPSQAEVLLNLDATSLADGPLTSWTNTGSVTGNFAVSDEASAPVVSSVAGVKGINMTSAAFFTGPAAPERVTADGARTIEAWVYNPSGSNFETIIAWGRRGTDNSNSAFSHGVHPTWGAFGGWGAADLDWQEKNVFGSWNYVVYTYDGFTSTVYSNGELANSEEIALSTFAVDTNSQPLPFRVGAANNADGTPFRDEPPSFTLGLIRVHDVALTAEEIRAKFETEQGPFGLLDSDSDGMPDGYELSYPFLNPDSAADAALDEDSDGLTNLEEYTSKTLPNNRDTDGDTVSDGAEVKRVFNGTPAPTNPLSSDTDGDGAPDGVETGTGIFVGPNDLGSNPLVADTDGDTYTDGQELLAGSNPNNANSIPAPKPVVDLDAAALAEGVVTAWPNAGSIGGSFTPSGTPQVTTLQTIKGVTLNGTTDFLTGPSVPAFLGGNSSRTVEAWVYNPAAADEETIFSWGRRGGPDGSNCSFNHGLNATFGAVGHWGGPDIGWNNVGPYTGRWTYVVYTWDGPNLTTAVYADGQEANTETLVAGLNTWTVSDTGAALPFRIGSQNDANGAATAGLRGSLSVARLRVHDRVLSATDISAKYTQEAGDFGLIDFDNDGLPTWYERQYSSFLNPNDASDAAKDQDTDGLTNLEEFQAGTNVEVADTDADGLSDGAEVKRTPQPTNPLLADTDQDGLADGAETNSDPTNPDTDADTFLDGQEVFHSSNPNLASSVPDLSTPVTLVDLNAAGLPAGPLAAWPDAGKLGRAFVAGVPGTVESVSGVNAVTFAGTQFYTGPSAPLFITGDGARTVDAWIYNPAANTEETIVAWGRRGGPDGTNASYTHGTNPTWGAMGQWGPYDVGWNGQVLAGEWTHVAFVYDPATTTAIVYSNGQVANTQVMPGTMSIFAVDSGDRQLPIRVAAQNEAGGAPGGQFGTLSIGRVRVYDGVVSPTAIAALYDAEKATYTTPVSLAFNAPAYDAAANRVTLTWSTIPNATYTLEGVESLGAAWQPVATGLTTPSYVIENVSTKPNTLYRVRTQ